MSDPERPEDGEPTEGGERTRESEIKANVEFWKDLGVEVDEADVRAKIEELPEVEGFDFMIYVPAGIEPEDIWEKIPGKKGDALYCFRGKYDLPRSYKSKEALEQFPPPEGIRLSRSSREKSYAIATRYQQEPDEDSLGDQAKSVKDWEATGETFMSPLEGMIAELRWSKQEGTHLNLKYPTLCPGNRGRREDIVPDLGYDPNQGVFWIMASSIEKKYPRYGVRRVITKDTKV